jgi:hypothetical protein
MGHVAYVASAEYVDDIAAAQLYTKTATLDQDVIS